MEYNINEIAVQDFLTYATSVIKHRAIPTIEDNLKPVHRRILFSMHENKIYSNKKRKKSATVVGEVIGKYHPHGDSSVYEAMVRLAQPWKMRYPLIDFQGNKGNVSGDKAAAHRYTEVRLSEVGQMMVKDLSPVTVPYVETFDGENKEPVVMTSAFPNILCNGTMGIAVGMSSSLLPHNLTEVVSAMVAYIENESITLDEILNHIKGPDFPTGGVITNAEDLKTVYTTGRGSVTVRGKYHIEQVGNNTHIVFTEIPYLTTIESKIIEPVQRLVIEEGFEDIVDIKNNSGKDIEIRVILKPKANVNRVLKTLFEKTGLRTTAKINHTVLVDGKPEVVGLKGLISNYIEHRHRIIIKVHMEKREKALKRLHIVDGLLIAMQDIDGVISIIKNSSDRSAAKSALMEGYKLTEAQSDAILNMRLSSINKLDANKLIQEKKELEENIKKLIKIINKKDIRNELIINSLKELDSKIGDARRTIIDSTNMDAIIDKHDLMIIMHDNNEVAIFNKTDLSISAKGRKGKKLTNKSAKGGIYLNTGNTIVLFDNLGKAYRVDGRLLEPSESLYLNDIDTRIAGDVTNIVEFTKEDLEKEYLVFVTANGNVKKTRISEYNNFKGTNYAIKLKENDTIISVNAANDDDYVYILGKTKINKFPVSDIKSTGRNTLGSKGMTTERVDSAAILSEKDMLFSYTVDGKGKVTAATDYSSSAKGGRGQVVGDGTIGIGSIKNGQITIFGSDNKAITLPTETVPVKNSKSSGIKLYGGEVAKILF